MRNCRSKAAGWIGNCGSSMKPTRSWRKFVKKMWIKFWTRTPSSLKSAIFFVLKMSGTKNWPATCRKCCLKRSACEIRKPTRSPTWRNWCRNMKKIRSSSSLKTLKSIIFRAASMISWNPIPMIRPKAPSSLQLIKNKWASPWRSMWPRMKNPKSPFLFWSRSPFDISFLSLFYSINNFYLLWIRRFRWKPTPGISILWSKFSLGSSPNKAGISFFTMNSRKTLI